MVEVYSRLRQWAEERDASVDWDANPIDCLDVPLRDKLYMLADRRGEDPGETAAELYAYYVDQEGGMTATEHPVDILAWCVTNQ